MPVFHRRSLPAFAASLLAATQSGAFAQSAGAALPGALPAGTLRLVVPYNPGGITDILARGMAQSLTPILGNTTVVENRPGANGSIGANMVARSPADGLTLLVGVTDTHAVNPAAMRNLPYDPERDFEPVSNITNVPLALAVGPTQREIVDLRAFIAAARARPGALTHSSWGVGSVSQIAMLRIGAAAGVELLHVPFTGAAPAQQALAAGQVDSMVMPAGAAEALARDGRVRVLATLSPARLALLPDVPTLQEQGVALSTTIFQAIFAPARTPAAAIARLNAAMGLALQTPSMLEILRAQAALPDHTTPAGLAQRAREEREAWGAVVRSANIRLD
ncbi:tripartite tricarboxylate transporter substrate binding protein [Sediminicoccus sp. KRV36]|uniref:Bug family tripartite tricarboxylate transporter substrate binding protein n=1 Tax=Sediminicoccus sp. KRV36 TaxID=3133721 RepID=UPI00200D86C2|nr:tripartite tricarboxylate transporter substrate binding protein [Sediminicoccus rosea]UPY35701.1 tripartite tricarboxylate transporter substrate binding protein [Sediminicoccus rosea]